VVGKGDDTDAPFGGGQERRRPRGQDVAAGTGMGDAGLVEATDRIQQPGHAKVGRVVIGQRGEVHPGDQQRLDYTWVGPKVERLVPTVLPPFSVIGQGALQVDEEAVGAPQGRQQIAPGIGKAPLGDHSVDHATEHHVADECQCHAWGHGSARSLSAIRFRRVGSVHPARAASASGRRFLLAAPSFHQIAQ
jgi:hypothetical protein